MNPILQIETDAEKAYLLLSEVIAVNSFQYPDRLRLVVVMKNNAEFVFSNLQSQSHLDKLHSDIVSHWKKFLSDK